MNYEEIKESYENDIIDKFIEMIKTNEFAKKEDIINSLIHKEIDSEKNCNHFIKNNLSIYFDMEDYVSKQWEELNKQAYQFRGVVNVVNHWKYFYSKEYINDHFNYLMKNSIYIINAKL